MKTKTKKQYLENEFNIIRKLVQELNKSGLDHKQVDYLAQAAQDLMRYELGITEEDIKKYYPKYSIEDLINE